MRGNADGLTKRQLLPSGAVSRARELRRNSTDAEKKLWRALREALPGPKFRRQVPLGPYFADFCSHAEKLVIEVDGGQHADTVEYDAACTRFIESEGNRVLRFWNNDVLANPDGVVAVVGQHLNGRNI
ncbi:endonuclease domain-containing protein [Sphingomonadaceae bacterium LXI357]|uniref:Endonuclease domain-containing protein n=2 Tax=Stakelama marina TaxID=2826939 RepID=A0A8T4IMB6_9SPHN|nr:DUF559 domain-containing protein [Stakelama marina]MBR0553459.1 endonuclease domain-containing protein [Stakelama marina]